MEFPDNPDTVAGQHSRRDLLKCIPLPHADTNALRLCRYPILAESGVSGTLIPGRASHLASQNGPGCAVWVPWMTHRFVVRSASRGSPVTILLSLVAGLCENRGWPNPAGSPFGEVIRAPLGMRNPEIRPRADGSSLPAEPSFPVLIGPHGPQEVDFAKSRPGHIAEIELAVGALP
jgi:hypothetical protein